LFDQVERAVKGLLKKLVMRQFPEFFFRDLRLFVLGQKYTRPMGLPSSPGAGPSTPLTAIASEAGEGSSALGAVATGDASPQRNNRSLAPQEPPLDGLVPGTERPLHSLHFICT
jgi:hypothetical protein